MNGRTSASQKIQAIGQNGLAYSKDPFDIERFEELRELALEILQNYTDSDLPRIRDLFAGEHGHATPKVDVRGVVFNEDAILLVRERADGKWTLPGGWVDVNESPSESVVREVFEESGYQTKALKLLACYDRNRHPHPPHPYQGPLSEPIVQVQAVYAPVGAVIHDRLFWRR